jgi:hypothetical protein
MGANPTVKVVLICYFKVDTINLVTYLIQTHVIEWYVVWCGSKNGYQKYMCLKKIGVCSKYVNHFRLNSQHNWGDLYDHFMSMSIFNLMLNKIFI